MSATRYYDPYTARFTQPDTLVPDPTSGQSYNRYSYVSNNPINYNDPTGHDACKGGGGGCGGVRGGPVETPARFYGQVHHGDLNGDGRLCESAPSTCGDVFGVPVRPPTPPTDPACAAVPQYCSAQPGTSGLGFDGEIAGIEFGESLGPDGFWDLASDPDEIDRLGLGYLNWSNDGCSNSPDGMGGISFLGACGQHDFSYRNRKAWEEATGENIFSQQTRREADDRLEAALETVCDARCGWATEAYWVAVHGYGDGGPVPGMGTWTPNPFPWDGWLPG